MQTLQMFPPELNSIMVGVVVGAISYETLTNLFKLSPGVAGIASALIFSALALRPTSIAASWWEKQLGGVTDNGPLQLDEFTGKFYR